MSLLSKRPLHMEPLHSCIAWTTKLECSTSLEPVEYLKLVQVYNVVNKDLPNTYFTLIFDKLCWYFRHQLWFKDQEVIINDYNMAVSIMQQIKILWKDFSQVRFFAIEFKFKVCSSSCQKVHNWYIKYIMMKLIFELNHC